MNKEMMYDNVCIIEIEARLPSFPNPDNILCGEWEHMILSRKLIYPFALGIFVRSYLRGRHREMSRQRLYSLYAHLTLVRIGSPAMKYSASQVPYYHVLKFKSTHIS